MKILQLCKDLFNKTPSENSVKKFFQQMREKENATSEDNIDSGFFCVCINYLGGRGYNEFLDYSLFAIKLNTIFDKYYLYNSEWESMKEVIADLLFDDRHDFWQNGSYGLHSFAKGFKDKNEHMVKEFWGLVVDSMIECINVRGTGDVSTSFVISEG